MTTILPSLPTEAELPLQMDDPGSNLIHSYSMCVVFGFMSYHVYMPFSHPVVYSLCMAANQQQALPLLATKCWRYDMLNLSKIFFQVKECFDYVDPNGFRTPLLWSARECSCLSWSTVVIRGDVGRQKPWKGLLSQHQNFCFGEEVFWLAFNYVEWYQFFFIICILFWSLGSFFLPSQC